MARNTSARPQARRLLTAAATVCLAFGAMVGLAATASANDRPVATTNATVTGTSASVATSVTRGTNQIRSATCKLDGASVPCGPGTSVGKKAATYTTQLTGLAGGHHTFTITITLTDGGTATTSTSFDSAQATVDPQTNCATAGGSYVDYPFTWACGLEFSSVNDDTSAFFDALDPACADPSTVVPSFEENANGVLVTYECRKASLTPLVTACAATTADASWDTERTYFLCETPADPGPTIASLSPLCTQLGGTFVDLGYADYECQAAG